MKNKIIHAVGSKAAAAHHFEETDQERLYIIDWKNINGGGVKLYDRPQKDSLGNAVSGACIDNLHRIPLSVDLFGENALPLKKGKQSQQCECIVFPSTCDDSDWLLLIELKYVSPASTTFPLYIDKVKSQISATASYLCDKGVIESSKPKYGMFSLPTLMKEAYSAFVTSVINTAEYFEQCGIMLIATDKAEIVDNRNINLII